MTILLTADEMKRAEAAAIKSGVTGLELMERAGTGVAAVVKRRWDKRRVAILCGPGNNGGDGFVIARHLKDAGFDVRVGLLGDRSFLSVDAAVMAERFDGNIEPATAATLKDAGIIIDALFGTGISRPIEGDAAQLIEQINRHPAPTVAVDIPSGIAPDSGAVLGAAVQAVHTVTFFLKKPGHVLFPGRAFCGGVDVVDIGISPEALKEINPRTVENQPQIWGGAFQLPSFQTHKYVRGAVAVFTGPRFATGAARLAAMAALRSGAGVVTLASPMSAADENAAHATALMVRVVETPEHVSAFMSDPRIKTAIIGPGAGVGEATANKVITLLNMPQSVVLDADALTSFEGGAEPLFGALRAEDVITPHGGEFMRLFGGRIESPTEKLSAGRLAAEKAGCVVVLKGPDTVIAAPDGRAAINTNAPADLATAGAGDVLAGLIGGLRAQGMPGFEAACAGVWLHGACGQAAGPGLIAEDLPKALPGIYRSLFRPQPQADEQGPSAGQPAGPA